MTWYTKLIVAAVLAGLCFASGMLYERGNMELFKGKTEGAAATQNAAATIANQQNTGEANVSEADLLASLKAKDDYYAANPVVRVRIEHGACIVSRSADNPPGGNEPADSMFVTACDPKDATAAAVTLATLQDRLRAAAARGAVIIK